MHLKEDLIIDTPLVNECVEKKKKKVQHLVGFEPTTCLQGVWSLAVQQPQPTSLVTQM